MRISDWSSDVCSSDLGRLTRATSAAATNWNTPGSQWPSAMPTIMHSATHSVSQRSNVFMAGFDGPMAASDMAFLSVDAPDPGVAQRRALFLGSRHMLRSGLDLGPRPVRAQCFPAHRADTDPR